jgi:hypothetical protein
METRKVAAPTREFIPPDNSGLRLIASGVLTTPADDREKYNEMKGILNSLSYSYTCEFRSDQPCWFRVSFRASLLHKTSGPV